MTLVYIRLVHVYTDHTSLRTYVRNLLQNIYAAFLFLPLVPLVHGLLLLLLYSMFRVFQIMMENIVRYYSVRLCGS